MKNVIIVLLLVCFFAQYHENIKSQQTINNWRTKYNNLEYENDIHKQWLLDFEEYHNEEVADAFRDAIEWDPILRDFQIIKDFPEHRFYEYNSSISESSEYYLEYQESAIDRLVDSVKAQTPKLIYL